MKYTKENLEPIVLSSTTWAEVARKLKLKPVSGSQSHLKKRADFLGINYKHFVGQSWSKGKIRGPKRALTFYLTKDSNESSSRIRNRLIKSGIKEPKCEKCGLEDWLGKPAPLELDHINGDHFDNTIENLMILCPNCHAIK